MYPDDGNILITGDSNAEIEKKFTNLAKNLETWVNSNGLIINLKKTNYMIFSNRAIQELPFTPKLFKYEIERKRVARFLGVIINENLTWNDHTQSLKAKMSRYVGILFKLKKILPLSARKNIFYSFVQSYLNYCSLVWGVGPKSNIEPLFTEQKKAVRSLMPGYNSNYYKDGLSPCHTKNFFTEHGIHTVHSIILTKILVFMHRFHNYRQHIPNLVANIISTNAPRNFVDAENCKEWLASHSTQKLRNALCFKGPLFYMKYYPEIIQGSEKMVIEQLTHLKTS